MNKFLKIIFGVVIFASLIVLTETKSDAFEIVYPKGNPVTISSPSTFFIGSADVNAPFTINGQPVEIHSSGGFAYVVQLKEGENIFELASKEQTLKFVINRPQKSFLQSIPDRYIEYETPLSANIKTERAPLRATPKDSGINRMSHFQKGVILKITGEKGMFYSVALDDKTTAWIAKADVEIIPPVETSATLSGWEKEETDDFEIYKFHLNKKVPYTIEESDKLTLKLFDIAEQPCNTYVLDVTPKRISGYDGHFEDTDFVFEVRRFPDINSKKPLKGVKIALDAGHGGAESGAIGCLGDKEKNINLEIAKNLESELRLRGADVIMTRKTDVNVSLKERVRIAESKDALILLSVHSNALPDTGNPAKTRGTSIYYYYNQAKPLAESILDKMTTQVKTNNDKVRRGSLALVRSTRCVSALVEVGYMINPDDNALLTDKVFQKDCATAIADGIEDYLIKGKL